MNGPDGTARLADRNLAVDGLKLALAVMVVAIHVEPLSSSGPASGPAAGGGPGQTIGLLTTDGLFRLAVPVFLVFNGWYMAPLVQRGDGWRVVRRAALLYLTWMLIYAPIWAPVVAGYSVLQMLRFLALGYAQLWYLSGLMVAAGLAVVLRHWPMGARLALGIALALCGTAMSLLIATGTWAPTALHALGITPNRNGLFLGFPYVALGMALWHWRPDLRLPRPFVAAAALAGLALVMAETLALGTLPVPVLHESMASLLVAVPAVALLALQSPLRTPSRALADHASGLFFLHMLFLALLRRNTDLSPPVIFALTLAGCLIVTEALLRLRLTHDLF